MSQKIKDSVSGSVSALIPEGTAATDAAPASGEAPRKQEASNRPVWTRQVGRVEASIWENFRNGKVEHSVAIFRSYTDRKSGETKRHHYFDEIDLKDVVQIANEARDELLGLRGLTQATLED